MSEKRRAVIPNPPRWVPNADPASIHVPGLDATASVLDQIEQMEQLITIRLQNIDENFSKIHHLLANKLLPAVKRYAVGTEPVREAAKFWTSFYEQAAQIHIPTYDDYSTVNELPTERVDVTAPDSLGPRDDMPHSQGFEPSMNSTESSFMPSQAAYSSTPATARIARTYDNISNRSSDDPSWSASVESPLVRLDKELREFSEEVTFGKSTSEKTAPLRFDDDEAKHDSRQQQQSIEARSDKESTRSLLRSVLRHNLVSTSDVSGKSSAFISPVRSRGKPKTPIPKKYNPYLPPDIDPANWSGVVDLRDLSINTPQRHGRIQPSPSRASATPARESDEDESFDGLPPGMSPPVMMSPARPPRSSAELGLLKLGQTPTKQASARITQDLLRDIQDKTGGQSQHMYRYLNSGIESSMSTIPTPPSLSRYQRYDADTSDSITMDTSLETMMRRVGLDVPPAVGTASTPGLRLRSRPPAQAAVSSSGSTFQPEFIDDVPTELVSPVHTHTELDSDSDSLDEINNTAHPSAAFLMASQGRHDCDDSFDSSNHSGDSLTEEDANLGLAPVHPFARGIEGDGFDDDDSFDDSGYDGGAAGELQEETLFGVPPSQRIRGQEPIRPAGRSGNGIRMLGDDLLQDTIGIGAQLALGGRVEESPTPATWPRG